MSLPAILRQLPGYVITGKEVQDLQSYRVKDPKNVQNGWITTVIELINNLGKAGSAEGILYCGSLEKREGSDEPVVPSFHTYKTGMQIKVTHNCDFTLRITYQSPTGLSYTFLPFKASADEVAKIKTYEVPLRDFL